MYSMEAANGPTSVFYILRASPINGLFTHALSDQDPKKAKTNNAFKLLFKMKSFNFGPKWTRSISIQNGRCYFSILPLPFYARPWMVLLVLLDLDLCGFIVVNGS
ncbi:hypothetical protein Droror1_Dr00014120 [Drosera rotundifolia]